MAKKRNQPQEAAASPLPSLKLLMPLKLADEAAARAMTTQTFAEHVQRAKDNGWTNYNGGLDLGLAIGDPVRCALGGKVTNKKDATGYGTHVRVTTIHEGHTILNIYAHMKAHAVNDGAIVEAGEEIGFGDSTGFSTGPHLHWELRIDGVPVDPMLFVVYSLDEEPTKPTEFIQLEEVQFHEQPMFLVDVQPFLFVRNAPSRNGAVMGQLNDGTIVRVNALVEENGNLWMDLSPDANGNPIYAAVLIDGVQYAFPLKGDGE